MHEKRVEIRWRDIDAFGHVNNAVYLTYFEEARDEWMEKVEADDLPATFPPPRTFATCWTVTSAPPPSGLTLKSLAAGVTSSQSSFVAVPGRLDETMLNVT